MKKEINPSDMIIEGSLVKFNSASDVMRVLKCDEKSIWVAGSNKNQYDRQDTILIMTVSDLKSYAYMGHKIFVNGKKRTYLALLRQVRPTSPAFKVNKIYKTTFSDTSLEGNLEFHCSL